MPRDSNDYAVDYRPRLTGWQPRLGLDDTGPIRPSTIKHAPIMPGQDYDTLTQGGRLKCYGPFDHGREHPYNAALGDLD